MNDTEKSNSASANRSQIDLLFKDLEAKYPLDKVINKLPIHRQYNHHNRILKEKLIELNTQPLVSALPHKIYKDLKKSGFKLKISELEQEIKDLTNEAIQ